MGIQICTKEIFFQANFHIKIEFERNNVPNWAKEFTYVQTTAKKGTNFIQSNPPANLLRPETGRFNQLYNYVSKIISKMG